MAIKPLPGYVRPGRLARRPRQFMLDRVARFGLVALMLVGALAIALLVLGLVGLHAVTEHFRIQELLPGAGGGSAGASMTGS